MAEFSKQYCITHPEIGPGDFDILEEASKIQNEHYIPLICEGYGFIALAKDEYGQIHLGFRDENDNINWLEYNEVVAIKH